MAVPNQEPEHLRKLFTGGLDYRTTEESLKAYFSQWGEIVDCIVMRDPQTRQSRGFGFVTYTHSSMLDEAFAQRPHVVDGCDIVSKRAVPKKSNEEPEQLRKLFVGGLDFQTTEQTLKAHFEQWGEVVDCMIKRHPGTKIPRGFGFVEYKHSYMVDNAQAARPHKVDGFEVETKRPFPKENSKKPEALEKVKKIYVGGIADDDTEEQLQEYFSEYGKVVGVNILTDRYSRNRRGFAFIEFDDHDSVDKIVLRKHTIGGRQREVKKALSRMYMNSIKVQEMHAFGKFRVCGGGPSRPIRGGLSTRNQGPYGGGFGSGRNNEHNSSNRQ